MCICKLFKEVAEMGAKQWKSFPASNVIEISLILICLGDHLSVMEAV
jgi:hypothetical protein